MGEIDGALVERLVEVAAPDQNEIHEVAGEFQQQPGRRVETPRAERPCLWLGKSAGGEIMEDGDSTVRTLILKWRF